MRLGKKDSDSAFVLGEWLPGVGGDVGWESEEELGGGKRPAER